MPALPDLIRGEILALYDALGRTGSRTPRGLSIATSRDLAGELGYPEESLGWLPSEVLEAFVGAAALAREVDGPSEGWVLDLGCGAGVDSLLLAQRGFSVASLDASPAMLRRLTRAASARGAAAAPVRAALPALPVKDNVASWVILNGVANLVPDRQLLLAETLRVLLPGGQLLLADLLALAEFPPELRELPEAWAWCVAGAASPAAWEDDLLAAGFAAPSIRVVEEIPPLGRGVIRARRPG